MAVRPCVKLYRLVGILVFVMLGLIPARPTMASSFTDRIIELTNWQRRRIMGNGCPALTPNGALMIAAQNHASDMADHNYFSHYGSAGDSFWQRIVWTGYQPRRAAENIAAGLTSPEEIVQAWLNSPRHRANLLNCRMHEIGVGVAQSDSAYYRIYWDQLVGTRR